MSEHQENTAAATAVTAPVPARPVVRAPNGRFVPGSGKPRARRSGGVVGNLNATRNPWDVFWNRRALRPQDAWVRRIVAQYAGGLVSDKGGADEVTAGEVHSIELAAIARACQCLLLDALRAEGGVSSKRGLDLLSALSRFATVEQRSLVAVGLERRAKEAPSLAQYLASRSPGPAGERKAGGTGADSPGPAPFDPGANGGAA